MNRSQHVGQGASVSASVELEVDAAVGAELEQEDAAEAPEVEFVGVAAVSVYALVNAPHFVSCSYSEEREISHCDNNSTRLFV